MKKIIFFFALPVTMLLVMIDFTQAQTLFTYGNHPVSKTEFLEAYNKNPDTTGNREEKLKQYLDLYVSFRLKLQAAYDEKANSNEELKSEADNFKNQLTEGYINQQANITKLLHEAFVRSQKDILLQQVFVKIDGDDTAGAYTQISKAYDALKAGKNFEDAAAEYSTDSSVKASKGNVGYITVFTLPYSMENVVYNLAPGNFSAIYKSKAGYHIFKNAGERNALGKRKVEQLLFPTPQFFTAHQKDSVAHIADSIYNLLQSGTPFITMAQVYGNNAYQLQSANVLQISVGDYSPDFENPVFDLKKPGDISKPFKTSYGYNIIKLDEILPVSKDENDVVYAGSLQTQIQNDGRLNVAKTNLVEKWLPVTGFKEAAYNHKDLWAYTDSALFLYDKMPALYKSFKPQTVLFRFTKEDITVKDWVDELKRQNVIIKPKGERDYEKLMHDYIRKTCNDYYREHIEDFDAAASAQIKEFNEANMLFYVMDKHVWSKASNDSTGLKKYYDEHKNNYTWKESVTALVISAPEKVIADSIALKVKNNPFLWRDIVTQYNNSIYADSNRFEIDQLPVKQKVQLQKDFQTMPEANDAGDSYTFIHVLEIYPQSQVRSFEEAKGLVINDYQQKLEQDWIAALKKTYPVKINAAVLDTLH